MGLKFLLLLSALQWKRLRVLCKLPDCRKWWWEKLKFALADRVMLSEILIPLSVMGGCTHSLLVICPDVTHPWSL